ncbi:MAG: hypothetical protein LBT45_03930 [Rickettsiales bacterium]|jgi:hypothetical protein|nr:hypothetical protein [Rickettsiales bacterium]
MSDKISERKEENNLPAKIVGDSGDKNIFPVVEAPANKEIDDMLERRAIDDGALTPEEIDALLSGASGEYDETPDYFRPRRGFIMAKENVIYPPVTKEQLVRQKLLQDNRQKQE